MVWNFFGSKIERHMKRWNWKKGERLIKASEILKFYSPEELDMDKHTYEILTSISEKLMKALDERDKVMKNGKLTQAECYRILNNSFGSPDEYFKSMNAGLNYTLSNIQGKKSIAYKIFKMNIIWAKRIVNILD